MTLTLHNYSRVARGVIRRYFPAGCSSKGRAVSFVAGRQLWNCCVGDHSMKDAKWTRLSLLVLLSFANLAWSQTGLTSLRGTVTDSSGALLAGSQISLDNPTTGFRASRNSDQSGAYEFPQIPPGRYTVTATRAGFGRQAKTAELLVSQPATIDFVLSVQAIEETVEVSDVA